MPVRAVLRRDATRRGRGHGGIDDEIGSRVPCRGIYRPRCHASPTCTQDHHPAVIMDHGSPVDPGPRPGPRAPAPATRVRACTREIRLLWPEVRKATINRVACGKVATATGRRRFSACPR